MGTLSAESSPKECDLSSWGQSVPGRKATLMWPLPLCAVGGGEFLVAEQVALRMQGKTRSWRVSEMVSALPGEKRRRQLGEHKCGGKFSERQIELSYPLGYLSQGLLQQEPKGCGPGTFPGLKEPEQAVANTLSGYHPLSTYHVLGTFQGLT